VTSAGTVRARQVLVCTDGYTDGAVPFLRRRLVPVRSRIIVTEELAPEVMARLMPKRMMMIEGRQLGFYYRPTPDGKRILLGGRDSSRAGDPDGPKLVLRRGLVNLFPELEQVRLSHTWFGNVAMHHDMLPRIFEKDGVVYATGFCGSGVVWAPWVGTRAAHKLLGIARKREPRSISGHRPFISALQRQPLVHAGHHPRLSDSGSHRPLPGQPLRRRPAPAAPCEPETAEDVTVAWRKTLFSTAPASLVDT
jgi:glycine/D-amino acid oxidase-like deaminating enzyme